MSLKFLKYRVATRRRFFAGPSKSNFSISLDSRVFIEGRSRRVGQILACGPGAVPVPGLESADRKQDALKISLAPFLDIFNDRTRENRS